MNSSQKSGLLVLGYNAPYGPIGAYPKLTSALQQGDMRSAAQHLQRGGPNASRIALERNLLLSGPTNLKNLVGPKIVGEKKVGSGIPFVPPFLYNMQKKQSGGIIDTSKMLWNMNKVADENQQTKPEDYGSQQGLVPNFMKKSEMVKDHGYRSGGVVKESDGSYNPHSSSDRRMFPIINTPNFMGIGALQPGEGIVTKRAMESGGETLVQNINALLDPNSEAAKSGVRSAIISNIKPKSPNISPPSNSRGRIAPITLPPITQSAGSAPTSSGGGTQVPPFSAVSPASMFVRINNADTYGIVG
jgi:hypothetical protein